MTTILISLAIGAVFGAILQRVQVSNPDLIHGTLALRDLTVLKFLLLAIGVGAVGVGALTAFDLAHLRFKGLPLLSVVSGGLIFGSGFAIAGYCPGTCVVGAAEGRKDALFALGGGLLGALAYAFAWPWAARFGTGRALRFASAAIGGFFVIFGARLAGGCTSGHVVSGMSQLAVSGMVFAAAVFLAGIPLARALFARSSP